MANVKSDKVKQPLDNLEKYRLFTEGKLKPFIYKDFNQCGSLLHKIMLEGERNNLVMYSGSLLPVWYRAGVVCIECLLIFGTYSVGFILGSYIFHGLNTLRKL